MVLVVTTIWVARSDDAYGGGGPPPGTGIDVVYIAVGTNFPDALGAGAGAGINGAPVIIVPTNPPIPGATATELERLDPQSIVIVGGTGVVSQAMEDAIEALLPNAGAAVRIAGGDRYQTNAAFSASIYPIEGWASNGAPAFTGPLPATNDVGAGHEGAYNDSDGHLYATIQLPHGATILEFKITAYDADGTYDVTAELRQVNALGGYEVLASVTTFDISFQTVSDFSITSGLALVDNETYTYVIKTDNSYHFTRIINVHIRYRLGTP